MRQKLCYFLLICSLACFGQQIKTDTIISNGVYKSYFCYDLKEPLYVTYDLYKGGGPCDRKKEHFNFAKCGLNSATNADYLNSGMEKGHLANAEDFAFDCSKEEKTFCYYNCVPQTRELNHGEWMRLEKKVRQKSKTVKLFVIAGSIFKNKRMGVNNIAIPDFCYKIVLHAVTKEVLWCMIFPNDKSGSGRNIPLAQLKEQLGYPLLP